MRIPQFKDPADNILAVVFVLILVLITGVFKHRAQNLEEVEQSYEVKLTHENRQCFQTCLQQCFEPVPNYQD